MAHYDPDSSPDTKWWLGLDDIERTRLVTAAHRKVQFNPGAKQFHSTLHVIVENQLALGAPAAVSQALVRLTSEGLTRHDAVHAIASVLAGYVYDAVQSHGAASDKSLPQAYDEAVSKLTAEKWRDG